MLIGGDIQVIVRRDERLKAAHMAHCLGGTATGEHDRTGVAAKTVQPIVAFGTDVDVYYAVPLGVFAGALAIFFVSLSEAHEGLKAEASKVPYRVKSRIRR